VKDKKDSSLHDLDAVLSTAPGRRFIWRVIAPVESDPVKSDTNLTYYALGVQASARALQNEIVTQHYHWYKLMLSERYSDDKENTCKSNDGE
jgi:hypothetical protein